VVGRKIRTAAMRPHRYGSVKGFGDMVAGWGSHSTRSDAPHKGSPDVVSPSYPQIYPHKTEERIGTIRRES
jgi:hypothetical protein